MIFALRRFGPCSRRMRVNSQSAESRSGMQMQLRLFSTTTIRVNGRSAWRQRGRSNSAKMRRVFSFMVKGPCACHAHGVGGQSCGGSFVDEVEAAIFGHAIGQKFSALEVVQGVNLADGV